MRPDLRVLCRLPVTKLGDDSGPVIARRSRPLARDDIRDLLRAGPLRFVVADAGQGFRWFAEADRFTFWKREVQPHLCPPDQWIDLDAFPGGLAYLASEWAPESGSPIVVLEAHH